MDINTISLMLWVPFLLVWLLATLIYCIKGLCKGAKPALVSLVSILAATILNLLIARLLASLLTPTLMKQIPPDLFDGLGAVSGMIQVLLVSIVGTLVVMLLFMLLLLIMTPIIETIGNTIMRKKTKAEPLTGSSRAVGAMLSMVSAPLFSLIFLLPLYGTLAAYTPAVRSVLDVIPVVSESAQQETYSLQPMSARATGMNQKTPSASDSDLQQLADILDCILQHPLVELSASAPMQSMYTTLSQVSVEQTSMNLSTMADVMTEAMEKISAITQAGDPLNAEAWRELLVFCRENVLTQDWAYTVYVMALEEASAWLEDDAAADEILDIMTWDSEEFMSNADAILDFAEAALDQNALAQLESGRFDALLGSGLHTDTGALLNATEQMTALKNLLYRRVLESAVPANADQVQAFVEKYPLEQLTDPAQQKQEIEAFSVLIQTQDAASLRNFFLLHPSLGENTLTDLRALLGIAA